METLHHGSSDWSPSSRSSGLFGAGAFTGPPDLSHAQREMGSSLPSAALGCCPLVLWRLKSTKSWMWGDSSTFLLLLVPQGQWPAG